MSRVVAVECSFCSDETKALVPQDASVVRTAQDINPGLPDDVDTAVSTSCSDGHEFVVLLRE